MATLTSTTAAIRRLIKDINSDLLADNEVEEAINGALRRYNKDRPRILVDDVTGDGGHYYLISSSLSDWVRGFSKVIQIDYDVSNRVSSDEIPYFLEPIDWTVYLSATDTEYLLLPNHAPGSSTDFRVWYTTPHDHTDSADTIYAEDLDAFRWLSASICCDILATKRAQTSDSTIGVDAVNYQSKQRQFAEESDRWFKKYAAHIGVPEDQGPEAAASFTEWDRPVGGVYGYTQEYIYHGRRTR